MKNTPSVCYNCNQCCDEERCYCDQEAFKAKVNEWQEERRNKNALEYLNKINKENSKNRTFFILACIIFMIGCLVFIRFI